MLFLQENIVIFTSVCLEYIYALSFYVNNFRYLQVLSLQYLKKDRKATVVFQLPTITF